MRKSLLLLTALLLSHGSARAQFQFTAARSQTGAGVQPQGLELADLNADGVLDVVAFPLGRNSFRVFLSGNGGWATGVVYGGGQNCSDIRAGDLDGDGDPDLLLAGERALATNGLALYLNSGSGAFTAASGLLPIDCATALVVDLDHTHGPDILAVGSANGLSGIAAVHRLFSTGVGGGYVDSVTQHTARLNFGLPRPSLGRFQPGSQLGFATPLRVGSTRGLGSIDLDASGGVLLSPVVALGAQYFGVSTGDYNSDGFQDALLMYAFDPEGTAQLVFGSATGAWIPGPSVPTGASFGRLLASGDIDGDGRLDLAAAAYAQPVVRLLKGDGLGGFTPAGSLAARGGLFGLALADLDQDGKQDLVMASDSGTAATQVLSWRFNTSPTLGAPDGRGAALRLSAWPNPARGDAFALTLSMPEAGNVRVRVYDVTGREVASLADGLMPAGLSTLRWDARGIRAGVYQAVAESPAGRAVTRLVRVK